MSRRSHPAEPRVAAPTVALLVALACLLALPAGAGAAPRLHAPPEAGARISTAGAEAARIRAYWTPARMRSAPPLLASGRSEPLALASFAPVDRRHRSPLRRQGPHLHPPGPRARLLLGDGDQQRQPAAGPDRRPLRQHRPARAGRLERLVALPRVRPRLHRRNRALRRLRRPPARNLRAEAVGQGGQPQLRHGRRPDQARTRAASTSPTRSAAAPRSRSTGRASSSSRPSATPARRGCCSAATRRRPAKTS